MRGKVTFGPTATFVRGITPAYAGKRYNSQAMLKQMGDHPRVCGEKQILFASHSVCQGSPPRMRGKVHRPHDHRHDTGITPAYAGKRTSAAMSSGTTGDHPRVCGEKFVELLLCLLLLGSPPRMRGKVITGDRHQIALGDHPRVCGEKFSKLMPNAWRMGSPPRMRGKVPDIPQEKPETGITPAYAGKSDKRNRCSSWTWDHPRVCGEKE